MTRTVRTVGTLVLVALLAAACGDDDATTVTGNGPADTATASTITLLTHDSFALSDATLDAFTRETGIAVDVIKAGDAGTMVSEAVLTAGNPLADVLYGIDTTFLQRGLDAGLFVPYESPGLSAVPEELQLDEAHRVTPVDYGDVCVNYWTDEIPGDPPTTLDDLTDPANRGELVVQNPESSSPGLAFLLATVAAKGDGWEDFWADLRANDVGVTAGWEEAYYGEFVAGGGDRSMVVSYASSPPAEVVFADPPVDQPPTGVLLDSCFRQVEFAGILAGTEHEDEAALLIDFMLSPPFQEDLPLSMFVFPAADGTALPPEFTEHAVVPDDPLTLDPAAIEANRDAWTDRWVELVLG